MSLHMRALPLIGALLGLLLWEAGGLAAQDAPPFDPPGPPPIPPGLSDRTHLPPGRPFEGGGFDPPGQDANVAVAGLGGDLAGTPAARVAGLRTALTNASLRGPDGTRLPARTQEVLLALATKPPESEAPLEADLVVDALTSRGNGEATDAAVDLARSLQGLLMVPDRRTEAAAALQRFRAASDSAFLADPSPAYPAIDAVVGALEASSDAVVRQEEHRVPWTIPGMAANSPTGFGADWGYVFVAASYQARTRYLTNDDGAVGAGFGLGDARDAVGLQLGLISFSTIDSGFGQRGGLDLHLHKTLPGDVGIAVGWESALHWGEDDSGSAQYVAASKWFTLSQDDRRPFSAVMLSAGLGNGRFQPEDDFAAGEDALSPFGSLALRVAAPVSLIADWTGQDLMLAGSLAPLKRHGLVVTAGVMDVTRTAGDGPRFVLGASFGHDFRRIR